MQLPVGIELRALHGEKWRRGMSDGEKFWFLGLQMAESVDLKEIHAFEPLDPRLVRHGSGAIEDFSRE